MNATHTPGPWKAERMGKASNFDRDRRYSIQGNDNTRRVAYVFGQFDEQHGADASLVAAAPDLLAALRQIVEMDESFGGRHQYAAIARAAIAKATSKA